MNLIKRLRQWFSRPDLRTPVSALMASLNELDKEAALSENGKRLLIGALANVERLEELLSYKDTMHSRIYSPRTSDATVFFSVQETLLLAEDNSQMSGSLKENLAVHYAVTHVDNGKKALELAREINPDIIIADVFIPDLNGYELCRILKTSVETSHIPIILLSALNEKENIIFGLEAGANDYVIKPFDFDILNARIRNIHQSREQLRKTIFSHNTLIRETSYTNELDIKFLDKAIGIVEKEIANSNFSINDFCRSLAMSRTSVYNKLKSLTNQPPNDFIRIIRLNKAKDFLASGKYTVSEVSYQVGFTDPKYFSTSFKKQFGISPSKIYK